MTEQPELFLVGVDSLCCGEKIRGTYGALLTLLVGRSLGTAKRRIMRSISDKNVPMSQDVNDSVIPGRRPTDDSCRTRFGVFPECPLCGGDLTPEHAHFKCFTCGWRDSCCD